METFIHIFSPAAPCFEHILAFYIPGNQEKRKILATLPLTGETVYHERASGGLVPSNTPVR